MAIIKTFNKATGVYEIDQQPKKQPHYVAFKHLSDRVSALEAQIASLINLLPQSWINH